jgi:hypothetical protein
VTGTLPVLFMATFCVLKLIATGEYGLVLPLMFAQMSADEPTMDATA